MNSSTAHIDGVSEYQANLETLRQIPYFSGMNLEPLKVLAYLCTRVSFKPGDTVFGHDETDGNAYYVLEGQTELVLENGTVAGGFGPGRFIGAMSLVADTTRLFTLKAKTETLCMMLSKKKFQKTVEQFPEILPKYMETVMQAVQDWEAKIILNHPDKVASGDAVTGVSLI